MQLRKPLVLCVLDGFGYSETEEFNAIKSAKTPALDSIFAKYPSTLLHASGMSVGLPDGQMGNSEVGHTALGLGRIVFQELPTISMAIENDSLKNIHELKSVVETLKETGCRCHLWGLLSDGGVHSHIDHLFALVDIMLENGIKTEVHASLDGRDTPPRSAIGYIQKFEKKFGNMARIVTVSGRYYSMDRDRRWERTEMAYNAMIRPTKLWKSALEYVNYCYKNGLTDEFVPPAAIKGYEGICDGDALIVFNFRSDRVRQMLSSLADETFSNFLLPPEVPKFSKILGVTEYSSEFSGKVGVLFKKKEPRNSLGEIISKAGLTQLRASETEKYPHVTFFFNGGREEPFMGEERILVGSPKVPTYDLEPKMSSAKLTSVVLDRINSDAQDVYIVNFANPDMVGHTGNFAATVKAIEAIDSCVGEIFTAVQRKKGHLIVTSDHGNAEEMFSKIDNQPHTAHTTNDVPFLLASDDYVGITLAGGGGLKDVAPTILDILNLNKPSDMSGESLILR